VLSWRERADNLSAPPLVSSSIRRSSPRALGRETRSAVVDTAGERARHEVGSPSRGQRLGEHEAR
jgi:hypothetical protein